MQFPNNDTLREELKLAFPTAKFSWTQKCWYLSDIAAIRRQLELEQKIEIGKAVYFQISEANKLALKRMYEELILKAYSQNTIKTYCNEFAQLLYVLKDVNVDTLSSDRLRAISYQGTRNVEAGYKASHTTETHIGYIVCYRLVFLWFFVKNFIRSI